MIEEIRNEVFKLLDVDENQFSEIDNDTDLANYGLDSLNAIEIVVLLESVFGVSIPDEDLIFEKLCTINKINETIEKCRGE